MIDRDGVDEPAPILPYDPTARENLDLMIDYGAALLAFNSAIEADQEFDAACRARAGVVS